MLTEMWNLHENVTTRKWTVLNLGRAFWRLTCELPADVGKQVAEITTGEVDSRNTGCPQGMV